MEPLDAIADPELRATLLHVRGSAEPVSADDAATALGVHRNVARGRLERLAGAGLLETRFERRTGRSGPGAGRPAKLYGPAPELRALEFPPRRLAALVGRLVDAVPAEELRRVGEAFGRDLAAAAGLRADGDLADAVERACAAVRSLGFQASLERVDGDTAIVRTPTCPLRPLVVERPETAEIDRGMWAGLVAHAVGAVDAADVACETHSCADGHRACEIVLRLKRP